jgi:hypothetical protein
MAEENKMKEVRVKEYKLKKRRKTNEDKRGRRGIIMRNGEGN